MSYTLLAPAQWAQAEFALAGLGGLTPHPTFGEHRRQFGAGIGWPTGEELKWDDKGRLLTHSPDTYKIPAIGDAPKIFNVNFLKNASQKMLFTERKRWANRR